VATSEEKRDKRFPLWSLDNPTEGCMRIQTDIVPTSQMVRWLLTLVVAQVTIHLLWLNYKKEGVCGDTYSGDVSSIRNISA